MQEKYTDIKTRYSKLFLPEQLDLLELEGIVEGDEFQYVYKPNDDTYLMLSTLKQELQHIPEDIFLCQLGSGSGIISGNLNRWLAQAGKKPLVHISVDINMDASLLSQKYYNKHNLNISQVNSSLFNNFTFRGLQANLKPDVIVFNPPYVPVQQEEIDNEKKYLSQKLKYVKENKKSIRDEEHNMIAYSYMGGLDGLAVTRRILRQLTWNCTFYFIVMGIQGHQQISKQINEKTAFDSCFSFKAELQTMQYAQFYNEHLFVLRLDIQTM